MFLALTPGVNFINVQQHIGSLESGFEQTLVQKMHAKNVVEIDGRRPRFQEKIGEDRFRERKNERRNYFTSKDWNSKER